MDAHVEGHVEGHVEEHGDSAAATNTRAGPHRGGGSCQACGGAPRGGVTAASTAGTGSAAEAATAANARPVGT